MHDSVCAELSNHPVTILSGLCPDWAEWDPNQPVQNAREAMQQADDWLGVPQVRCVRGVSHKVLFNLLYLNWVSDGWGGSRRE